MHECEYCGEQACGKRACIEALLANADYFAAEAQARTAIAARDTARDLAFMKASDAAKIARASREQR